MDVESYVKGKEIDRFINVMDIKKTAYIPIKQEYQTDAVVT